MIKISRTTSADKDFMALVKLLAADLAIRDGEEHSFYAPFNKIDLLIPNYGQYAEVENSVCFEKSIRK